MTTTSSTKTTSQDKILAAAEAGGWTVEIYRGARLHAAPGLQCFRTASAVAFGRDGRSEGDPVVRVALTANSYRAPRVLICWFSPTGAFLGRDVSAPGSDWTGYCQSVSSLVRYLGQHGPTGEAAREAARAAREAQERQEQADRATGAHREAATELLNARIKAGFAFADARTTTTDIDTFVQAVLADPRVEAYFAAKAKHDATLAAYNRTHEVTV